MVQLITKLDKTLFSDFMNHFWNVFALYVDKSKKYTTLEMSTA